MNRRGRKDVLNLADPVDFGRHDNEKSRWDFRYHIYRNEKRKNTENRKRRDLAANSDRRAVLR